MKKNAVLGMLLVGAAVLVTFAVSENNDFQKSAGSFLATIGLQTATSSPGAVSSSTPTLAGTLQKFQEQIQSLNNQIADLRSEVEINGLKGIFTRSLKRGDKGDDVKILQGLLTKFPYLYPSDVDLSGTVTGYYGSTTKAAVAQFQSQLGLPETGVFDSGTRDKFYESVNTFSQDAASNGFTSVDIASISDPGNFSKGNVVDLQNQVSQLASDSAGTQASVADLQNQVAQLSSDLGSEQTQIADLQNQLLALKPSLSPAPALTPAPAPSLTISNIQVTSIGQQSATVTWTTNSSSSSEVDYSTDATLLASKTLIVSSATLVTSHSLKLQNLNSGTKYYYRVISKDSANNTVSGAIQNFTTLHG